MKRKIIQITAAVFFIIVLAPSSFAQDTSSPGTQTQDTSQQQQNQEQKQTQQPPAKKRVYDPYTADEFPEWLLDLRRGEIILFGSFPFTFFFTTEGYDIFRLSTHNFDSAYAPWPLKDPEKGPYSIDEQVGVVIAAASLSLVIAVVDYIVRKSSEESARATVSNEDAHGQATGESGKENDVSIPPETQEQGNR